jgi:glycosyltransferase involved in cell wall biosynthesis
MPNAVLEAFAARVPVVATAVGGTPEVIEEGVSGYLVPPGDASALAARILDALACEERRRAMGLRGHQRVAEEFTFAAQSQQYQALFRRLTGPEAGQRTDQLCASTR